MLDHLFRQIMSCRLSFIGHFDFPPQEGVPFFSAKRLWLSLATDDMGFSTPILN
jgi:hypothetical protein